jgi:hypothetical protein
MCAFEETGFQRFRQWRSWQYAPKGGLDRPAGVNCPIAPAADIQVFAISPYERIA